jgi:hypothetical protein
MQFLFLLLFNVFLGAVLYLVISLKLERSATEFRERRLRKEMDEIIKEFNVTAERNISILEGKIRLLRLLLEKTGNIKSLDITIAEEAEDPPRETRDNGDAGQREKEKASPAAVDDRGSEREYIAENNAGDLIKKGLILFFNKIINILPRKESGASYNGRVLDGGNAVEGGVSTLQVPLSAMQDGPNALIKKDMGAAPPAMAPLPQRKKLMTENDILEIVSMADDRYQLVSLLSERGCDIEDISRYSGIPAGEVRLVLNLNKEASERSL